VLADVARECGAELIVIGSRSRRFPRRRLGPVARGLDRGAPCQVVLAGKGEAVGSPHSRVNRSPKR
jgi:nucleotide-binding universal stress UspA family protein